MRKMPFFIVMAAVIAAGCASNTPVGGGITIKELTFSPVLIYGNQPTALTLTVQNTGSLDVKNAYVKIYNYGEALWNVEPKDTTTKPFSLRAQAGGLAGTSGEQKRFAWKMASNDIIPKDATRTYNAYGRVCYPYSTKALGRIELLSPDEWMSRNPIQHDIVLSQKAAPIRISVMSKQPIMKSDKISLDVLIENIGGGNAATEGYCAKAFGGDTKGTNINLNQINLKVSGITSEDCKVNSETAGAKDIFLEQGKREKLTVTCNLGGNPDPVTTADAVFELKYDYYTDAKATIRVKGPLNEGGGTVTPPTGCSDCIIKEEIPDCYVSLVDYDTGGQKVDATQDASGNYKITCSITGKVGIGISSAENGPWEYMVIKGKKLTYGTTEYTLSSGENKIAVTKQCGTTKRAIKLTVESPGTCTTGYGYILSAPAI